MSVRVIQGFVVSNFTGRGSVVKAILSADKDDIRAGDGDISDVLESLELHSTAGDSSTITLALKNSEEAEHSTPYEFSVKRFDVKQDSIKIVVEAVLSEIGFEVLGALGTHSSSEDDSRFVELTMQRPD